MTKEELVQHFESLKKAIKEYRDDNRYSHFNRMLLKVEAQMNQAINAFGLKKQKFTTTPPIKFVPPKTEKVEEVEDDSVVLADNGETRDALKKASRRRKKKQDDTNND